jgi:GNAT superfamily N-acetyltransferase
MQMAGSREGGLSEGKGTFAVPLYAPLLLVMNFELISSPDEELVADLWKRLHDVGLARLARADMQETAFYAGLLKEGDTLIAAFMAYIFFRGCNLQYLYVDEKHRSAGLGTQMLERVEELARQHRCTVIFGYSFGFQAPAFYTRLGYTEFGRIHDYPEGHDCIFLKKDLK